MRSTEGLAPDDEDGDGDEDGDAEVCREKMLRRRKGEKS